MPKKRQVDDAEVTSRFERVPFFKINKWYPGISTHQRLYRLIEKGIDGIRLESCPAPNIYCGRYLVSIADMERFNEMKSYKPDANFRRINPEFATR